MIFFLAYHMNLYCLASKNINVKTALFFCVWIYNFIHNGGMTQHQGCMMRFSGTGENSRKSSLICKNLLSYSSTLTRTTICSLTFRYSLNKVLIFIITSSVISCSHILSTAVDVKTEPVNWAVHWELKRLLDYLI